ncbi:MAG: 3-deoxy-7-phosphoheptulonate synthase [Micavibrio sp.]|nr:3-deoxy-7-phosphoheptulonate synthase [Micavibrio sp.]
MFYIGRSAQLHVVKEVEFGLYLDGDNFGEVLLPKRYVPAGVQPGDWLDVFLYRDSEDIVIATTEKPFVQVGECAHLKVAQVNDYGAFLDWGLSKDLFVPFKEQRVPMEQGRSYTVCVFEDITGRICASSKLSLYLGEKNEGMFTAGEAVHLMIASRSPLGYKAIINGAYLGLIHNNDVLGALKPGQKISGYIKKIRPDDSIDLTLQQQGTEMKTGLAEQILIDLAKAGGTSTLTDKSPPDEIFQWYQVSKANYKKVIGQLYREKKILIEDGRIVLVK